MADHIRFLTFWKGRWRWVVNSRHAQGAPRVKDNHPLSKRWSASRRGRQPRTKPRRQNAGDGIEQKNGGISARLGLAPMRALSVTKTGSVGEAYLRVMAIRVGERQRKKRCCVDE